MFTQLISSVFDGIGIASVLLIVALGLAIVFGLMGVINLAHGELMMLGAYTTYVVQNVFKQFDSPALMNIYIFVAIPLAFLVAALVGLALEKSVICYLYGRPLETLLATWGVSLILRQFVRSVNTAMIIGIVIFCVLFFGGQWALKKFADWDRVRPWAMPTLSILSSAIALLSMYLMNQASLKWLTSLWFSARNVDVTAPPWLRGGLAIGNGIQLPYARVFIIVLTALCVLGIYWFLNRSAWGLRIRSVTQNRNMSACLGIPTGTVDALTFALGSGLAGIAGFAVTLLGSVGPNLGGNYIVDAFMVVVVGGVGKILGSIVAALAIGVLTYVIGSGTIPLLLSPYPALQPITDFFTFFATTSMAKVMVFALIIVFLQFRPAGIFPQKGRMVDA
ncbi:MAG: branched-chain amino acid ABC transporter permease [Synechococcales cyanobacterium T60_A2020_003]|nr:branched-chain amino acid ABC transporter permease [Synechococcales cyanobacterium T60_A2020_003]